MGRPRRAVLSLTAVAAVLLLAAAVTDARVVILFHPGHSLADLPASKSPAAAAIKAALAKAKEVDQEARKISAGAAPRVKKCLDVCRENFRQAIQGLEAADEYVVHRGWSHAYLTGELSYAMSAVESCGDAFDEEPGLESPIANGYTQLRETVKTSLDKASELP